TLSSPSGFAANSGQTSLLTVKVTQYQDGAIYGLLATVAIPGATLVSSTTATAASAGLGNWVIEESHWSIPAEATANSIVITSANDGSLIDTVSVESSSGTVQAPQLSIRRVGAENNQVEISWPASYENARSE